MDKLGGWMAGWLDAPLALADDAVVLQLPPASPPSLVDGSSATLHHQLPPTSTR